MTGRWLTDLAEACRSTGLPVVEIAGWETRGHTGFECLETILCHHTGGPSVAPNDYPSLRTVRDGKGAGEDRLEGPLAQVGLGYSGTVYVIASGVSWHAGEVFEDWQDNWHALGIEAEHDGVTLWPAAKYDAYVQLVAGLATWYRIPVTSRVRGHKEVAEPLGRKPDPNFDMAFFRRQVIAWQNRPPGEDPDVTPEQIRELAELIRQDIRQDVANTKIDVTQTEILKNVYAELTNLTAAVKKLSDAFHTTTLDGTDD